MQFTNILFQKGKSQMWHDKIKALCPNSYRKVYVTDDWYPSYTDDQNGREYVDCSVRCGYHQGEFFVTISFWGADDFGLGKSFAGENMYDVVKVYRNFRKYARKTPHGRNLQTILYRDGFSYDY